MSASTGCSKRICLSGTDDVFLGYSEGVARWNSLVCVWCGEIVPLAEKGFGFMVQKQITEGRRKKVLKERCVWAALGTVRTSVNQIMNQGK